MSYKKLQVVRCSTNFNEATQVVQVPLVDPAPEQIRIRQIYGGINAVDLQVVSGQMFSDAKVPYDIGLEALGVVDAIGSSVEKNKFSIRQSVLVMDRNKQSGFAQYSYKSVDDLIPVPVLNQKFLVAGINSLTAVIGLETAGQIKAGEKVLITAASGGTGQIAVQWAKMKGCFVIGLTSNEEKEKYLKELGADQVINYREQNLDQVLKDNFPNGIDVIWKTIGGDTFKTLFNHLAFNGRMVILGSIEDYKQGAGHKSVSVPDLNAQLIHMAKSLRGFNLGSRPDCIPIYLPQIINGIAQNKIKAQVDIGERCPNGKFVGLEQVHRAEEWLHSAKNIGKVIVQIQSE